MPDLRFDHPEFLLLGLVLVPLLWFGWHALQTTDRLRRWTSLGLRTVLMLALTIVLAGPHKSKTHDHITVIGVLDISGSVQRFGNLPPLSEIVKPDSHTTEQNQTEPDAASHRSNIAYLRQWFRLATRIKEPDDRFGLVVFDGKASAISAPTKGRYVDDNLDVSLAQGTNIADAVRLAIAMFPADTSKRIVLVSDGNETAGSVLDAVRQISTSRNPANTDDQSRKLTPIPIDVLPIAYNVTHDVQVARVEVPPTAQPGQTVPVRIILDAASPTRGRLTLRREGVPVDLNGPQAGSARIVELRAGQSVQLAQVQLGHTPINRFEAIFEAEKPTDDVLPDNDRAEAFTATPSKGTALVINSRAGQVPNLLAQLLNNAGIPATAQMPAELPEDLLSLQNYDLVVLDNVAAAELSANQQQLLAKYVHDLGGGLIMAGGENSFGAGGWNGTPIEDVLPLELDPSKELRLPTAALVLVLDKSGSMNQPVAGARKSQQQIANEGAALAIESLRSDNLVGVVTFDSFAQIVIPLQPNDDSGKIADRVRGIRPEGGTNLGPGLSKAFDMLRDAKVDKKRVVCMSDGRSQSTEDLADLAKRMADAGVQVSSIAVGDDADHETLRQIAEQGGGEFYAVRDPRTLPRVLVDSVQIMNKPLIKEGPFIPQVLATGSTLTAGLTQSPELAGLVITSSRPDPKITVEMLHPDGEPLLAHWQAGLGRAAAFTSNAPGTGAWAQRWVDWPTASTFWVQLARLISRPAFSQDAELLVAMQDDRLHITYDMLQFGLETEAESVRKGYVQVEGVIYKPDGTSAPIRLRQSAPGRYEAQADASLAGNYIVALNPRQGTRQLSPAIGGASRSTGLEFRRYASNLALLEEIIDTTRGRRLDVTDPAAANLFDRNGMPPSVSLLPLWHVFVGWILALLLLDVASRRLAWDYNLIRNAVTRAVAKITPSHVRGRRAADTLATLRRVSTEVDERNSSSSKGIKKFETTGRVAPPPPRNLSDENVPPERVPNADPNRVAAALDAFLGKSVPKLRPEDRPHSVDVQVEAPENTTANLLAAKRRLREQLGDSPDQTQDNT
jgi:Ca-activated chloride channel homolog